MLVKWPASSKVITSMTLTVQGPMMAEKAIAAELPCELRMGASKVSLAPVAMLFG